MSLKSKLSIPKQLKIKSFDLLFGSEKGKYFPIKSTNIAQYVPHLRRTIPHEYYGELIKEVTALHAADHVFLNGKRKRTLKDLCSEIPFHLKLDAEFSWAKNILETSLHELNLFVGLSKAYSDLLLNGSYGEANIKLDEIENLFGYSIWLIKNRIALLQLSEGLEVQKRFTQEIKNGLKNGSMPRFLIHWISVRNEEQTSVSRFTSQVNDAIADLHPIRQEGFDKYIKYHLLGIEPIDPAEYIHIVRVSYATSIIDLYESFIGLLGVLTIHIDQKSVAKVYHYLAKDEVVSDSRINLLKLLFQINQPELRKTEPDAVVFNLLLKGDFAEAEACALQHSYSHASNPALLIAHAHLEALKVESVEEMQAIADDSGKLKQIPLRSLLIEKMAKIISKGIVAASKEYNELNKLSLNFNGFPWVATISHIILEENFLMENVNEVMALLPLKAAVVHPVFLANISSGRAKSEFTKLCNYSFADSIVLKYHLELDDIMYISDFNDLSQIHSNYIRAIRKFKSEKYNEAIGYCAPLLESNYGYFKRRGYGLISRSYLRTNNIIAACEVASRCYVYNREYHPFLPLQEYAQIITPGSPKWRMVSHLIDLSIICDAYVRQIGHELETARRFAYEDFLIGLGIEKPCDLKPYIDSLDRGKLIYYLSNICIESNMDTSGAFEGGSQEVIKERLAICRILTDLDTANVNVYRAEINELVRKLVINSRRQEVDQSRIYVDIQSVKEKAEVELKENFERYKAYIKYDLKPLVSSDSIFSTAQGAKEKINVNSVITTPENEFWELLGFLLNDVKKLYLSVNFGLDRFISTRIRHGELERNMRSPIQNHNLITKRKVKNGPYLRNDFWLSKVNLPSEKMRSLNIIFVRFSENYDNLISKIANDWLQIKKSGKPNGLFDFEILGADLEQIANTVNAETKLSEFVDILIQHLDNKLIVSLLNIRDQLYNDGKSQGKSLLNELLENINNLVPLGIPDFQSAVNQARTELGAQFDKIVEWFVPSYSGNSSPYSIEDAVMVAEAIVKEGHPSFKVNVEADEDSMFLIHGRLPIFMDVFINIFDNVVHRSGLDIPVADVKIWASSPEESITIIDCSVTNLLGEHIDARQVAADLKRKKSLLEAETYHDYLALEGNSGLFKIYKSVKDFYMKDSTLEPTVDFGVDERQYKITLSVPFKLYTLQPDEEIN